VNIPDRLGKYEVKAVLGKGAMGIVYQAFDPQIERVVALKTVRKDNMDPELATQFMARFKNEAKAAGRLRHPNIVGIYEFGEDDSVAFIAMEYVDGTGLGEHLNRNTPFGFIQITGIVEQLLLALEYAHGCGVIHRDIKPANLILTTRGELKLADFGIARIDTSELTMVGAVLGTPSYMSPEQCQGGQIDHRSDLFSVGVVLYELLTCEKPFTGTVDTIMYKICREEPRPASQVSKGAFPPAIDALLAKALAKSPDARFQNAQEFRQALQRAAGAAAPADGSTEATMVAGPAPLPVPPPTHPAWDDTVLTTAERLLARFVGPLARVYVRKAAAQAADLGELYSLLAAGIVDPQRRRQFVGEASVIKPATTGARTQGQAGTHSGATGSQGSASSPDRRSATGSGVHAQSAPVQQPFIDATTARLAVFLGPIARVVAKKAAAHAGSQEEFVRLVAGYIGTQDRHAFLREMGMDPE
jgi:serine/threonine-protein kinase